ncbi:MAG: heme o synthase [Alphaproteobacteria bacterium]
MIKPYFKLMKPGIIMGNLVYGLGGFFYASHSTMVLPIFIGTMLGLIFIIGSACAFNNVYDMDIDSLMKRTQDRPMVKREIGKQKALIFATIVGLLGFACLWFLSSKTAFWAGLFAFFMYVVAYTMWTKRQSVWGTFTGSLSGAVPVLVGYVAITDSITTEIIFIYLMCVIWQMPHSYGIAIFRLDDYKKADINVLPVVKGLATTRNSIMLHISAFVVLLSIFGYMGYMHPIGLLFILSLSLYWLFVAVFSFKEETQEKWAKKIFFQSIFIVVVLSLCLGFNGILIDL